MKKIIEKTRKEREEKISTTAIKVSDTQYYFWACDKCKIAYFSADEILKDQNGRERCPRIKKSLFMKEKICLNGLTGGDEDCFNRFYNINE